MISPFRCRPINIEAIVGKTATTVSAYDGFAMAVPIFNPDGTCGLDLKPIVAWQIEGAHADTGQLVPVTKRDADRT